ncbi:MAG: hypothetical protein ACREQ9_03710 [Candidatus Binatia bacterium]
MMKALALAAGVLHAGLAFAQAPDVLPVAAQSPSINSVRPGTIAAGSADTPITIYGVGFAGDAAEIVWTSGAGTTIFPATAVAGHESTRLEASVPSSLLAQAGTATLLVRRVTSGTETNAVEMTIGPVPSCAGKGAECGAAIGVVPVVEIVPLHTWTPVVAAPSGGLVRVENRDTLAQFGRHTFTSTDLTDPYSFSQITAGKIRGDGRFSVDLATPASAEEPNTGYVLVPEDEATGTVIGFFCTAHNLAMVTPLGGLLVQ